MSQTPAYGALAHRSAARRAAMSQTPAYGAFAHRSRGGRALSAIHGGCCPTRRRSADGALSVGGCSVADLAAEFGTPLFVYDEAHLRTRCREAVAAFGHERVIYATKAFLCRAMARLAYDEGLLLDVASGGELHVALAAGVPAAACALHGNNKSLAELRMAIAAGVRHIVVDSFDELDRLDALAATGVGPTPKVLLRITPGVHAHTHEFIATGQDDSKFGFNLGNGDALRAVDRARRSSSVELVGLHCHIGSNVFEASSFAKAAEVMADFAVPLDLARAGARRRPRCGVRRERGSADDHAVGQRRCSTRATRSACVRT